MTDDNYKVTIEYLRGTAIILVIFGHAISYYYAHFSEITTVANVVIILVYSINVPLFFVIAGYLFHKQPIEKYYLKKARRILIPFVFFSLLKICYNLIISNDFSHGNNIREMLINAFVYGDYYWFPYCILTIFIFAPLLWNLNRKWICCCFILVLIINIVLGIFDVLPGRSIFQLSYSFVNLTWFLFGYVFQLYPEMKRYLNKSYLPVWVAIISICGIVLIYTLYDTRPQFVFKFVLSVSISYIFYLIYEKCDRDLLLLKMASKYSLQIYFFDSFFKTVLFSVFKEFIVVNWATIIAITLIDVILSIVVSCFCEKIRVLNILVGL